MTSNCLPQLGVYSKIPGDGREYLVTTPSATKIRAEDGRQITGVDISNFINNLPQNKDTTQFYSCDASGSTSQAAAIMEYLELGLSWFTASNYYLLPKTPRL